MTKDEKGLPLGAVRTMDGEVMVPASRRADGSMRKPIRIREGYVPQDEKPKYKTVVQRRREQESKRAAEVERGGNAAVDEIEMDKLSLGQKMEARAAKERPGGSDKAPHREKEDHQLQVGKFKRPATTAGTTVEEPAIDRQQQLKRQLTKINKQLKEIAKLEDAEMALLLKHQKQKVSLKTQLQHQRNEIIAELNGATVMRRSNPATGLCSKVAISL